ncbi:MAG: hypothetical protein O7H41_16150 [Planctomycetota bacterium]|nr:hypothetical protein [Planctomycetota bacterium]
MEASTRCGSNFLGRGLTKAFISLERNQLMHVLPLRLVEEQDGGVNRALFLDWDEVPCYGGVVLTQKRVSTFPSAISDGGKPMNQDLIRRIARLERMNRKILRAGLLLVLGLITVVLLEVGCKPRTPRVVRAENLAIIDGNGKIRAMLGAAPDGGVGFFLRDKNEKDRVRLIVDDDGIAGIALRDGSGRERASLATTPEGSTRLTFLDLKGTDRIRLGVERDQRGFLEFSDANGDTRLSLSVVWNGATILSAMEGDQRFRSILLVAPDGTTAFSLGTGSPKGQAKILLKVDKDGNPTAEFHDASGEPVWTAP